jgi:uncharacterized protein
VVYYADTSALIKCYVMELGTQWIAGLCAPSTGNVIATALIPKAEAAAALARKLRQGGVSHSDYHSVLRDLDHDFRREYVLVQIDPSLIDLAVVLAQRQKTARL